MAASLIRSVSTARASLSRGMASGAKVAVLGGAGGIGQPLAMLMKLNPLVSEVSLYDIQGAPGVAADLSHISSPATITGYGGDDLAAALEGCHHVVIPAGVPRKPGMERADLFNFNAGVTKTLAEAVAENCPDAFVSIITNPVNSTVPIFAEALRAAGVFDPNKIAGVTHLDVVRAKTFLAALKGLDPNDIDMPVIGGHAGTTILPLLSRNNQGLTFTDEEIAALTHRIQFGGDEVVKAKDGAGSATLSTAFASAEFVNGVLEARAGKEGVVMCAFVESDVVDGLQFFSNPLRFGANGVEENLGYGELTEFEQTGLNDMIEPLSGQIASGLNFGKE